MTAQGVMFKFTYRVKPGKKDEVFDVVRFFEGSDGNLIKLNAKHWASKTGAIAVSNLTPEQYLELLNEETEQTETTVITA